MNRKGISAGLEEWESFPRLKDEIPAWINRRANCLYKMQKF